MNATSFTSFPHDLIVDILTQCDGPALDAMLTVSKQLSSPVNEARRRIVGQLARRPGRITDELVPTRLELRAMGFVQPNMVAVLNAMQGSAVVSGVPGPLMRNVQAHADLQSVQHKYGGLAQRAVAKTVSDIGECNANDQTHGFGIRIAARPSAERYEGQFVNGEPHGLGYGVGMFGEHFEGFFEDCELNGYASVIHVNGDRYEGFFEGGALYGQGTLIHGNGYRYEGAFEDGLRQGEGVAFFGNGIRFEGMFENDRAHGHGKTIYADGTRYEGNFKDGSRHGPGTCFGLDGERYEVTFANGFAHGPGIMTDACGKRRALSRDEVELIASAFKQVLSLSP